MMGVWLWSGCTPHDGCVIVVWMYAFMMSVWLWSRCMPHDGCVIVVWMYTS